MFFLFIVYILNHSLSIESLVYQIPGGVLEKLLPEEDYFSQALYTFDIGQNDLTAGYKLNFTSEQIKAYIPDVLRQFANVVKVRH